MIVRSWKQEEGPGPGSPVLRCIMVRGDVTLGRGFFLGDGCALIRSGGRLLADSGSLNEAS